jgi:hypothetical protein
MFGVSDRVARWFVFKQKIPIWVNFVGSCYGKSWYILWPFGLFYANSKYFVAILYIFGNVVYFSPLRYFIPIKIWQPWFRTFFAHDLLWMLALNSGHYPSVTIIQVYQLSVFTWLLWDI